MNPAETGLYYLQSRYYDAEVGRFISADSQINYDEEVLGTNLYLYCNNNSINYSDPNGHMAVAIEIALISVLVVLVYTAIKNAVEYSVEHLDDVARSVRDTVKTAKKVLNPKDQSVYVLHPKGDETDIRYIGRTNDPDRRLAEHQNDPKHPERAGYDMKVIATGLTVNQARSMEQTIISAFTIQDLDNAIRSIAKKKVWDFQGEFSRSLELFSAYCEDELMHLTGR